MYDWKLVDPFLNSWVLMGQAFDAANRATEAELGRYGMTLAQFHILILLDCSKGPMTPGDMATYVFREKHSISALLTRMQKIGHVRKVRSKKDQRVIKVSITAKGKGLLEKVKPIGLGYARAQFASCFSEQELKGFDLYLRKLRDSAVKSLGKKMEPLPRGVLDTPALVT